MPAGWHPRSRRAGGLTQARFLARGVGTPAPVGTLSDVALLSREVFDAIEFDAACTGDHRAAAQQMTLLADTGTQTPGMPRAEAYTRAGEQWLLADEPAAAANGFMRALEDGGPSFVDPRAPLARALFMMDRTEAAEAVPALPPGDRAELRLLLSLRFRIRNDIGLPEDAYDRLLDDLSSGPGTFAS